MNESKIIQLFCKIRKDNANFLVEVLPEYIREGKSGEQLKKCLSDGKECGSSGCKFSRFGKSIGSSGGRDPF